MKVVKPVKVRTPRAPETDPMETPNSNETLETPESRRKRRKAKKKAKERKLKLRMKAGRPSKTPPKARRAKINLRANYTDEDVVEAVRLVRMENFSKKAAALFINERKANIVPRMTLVDRLARESPLKKPKIGRPTVLSAKAEEGLVKCLEIAAEFNYPMSKRHLQELVQD